MIKIAGVNPAVLDAGMDVFLQSSGSPKMDVLAERVRADMVKAGKIPLSQLTDTEKEELQKQQEAAAQQPKELSPEQKIGEAELAKARADVADTQSKIEDRNKRFELDRVVKESQLDDEDNKNKIAMMKLEQQEDVNLMKFDQQQFDQQQAVNAAILDQLKSQADILNTLKDAMGVDKIIGPSAVEAYANQAEMITDSQEELGQTSIVQDAEIIQDNQIL
jgi:hypothetical protein